MVYTSSGRVERSASGSLTAGIGWQVVSVCRTGFSGAAKRCHVMSRDLIGPAHFRDSQFNRGEVPSELQGKTDSDPTHLHRHAAMCGGGTRRVRLSRVRNALRIPGRASRTSTSAPCWKEFGQSTTYRGHRLLIAFSGLDQFNRLVDNRGGSMCHLVSYQHHGIAKDFYRIYKQVIRFDMSKRPFSKHTKCYHTCAKDLGSMLAMAHLPP